MSGAVLASSGPSAYWYLTRSTGAVALVLLSVTVVLGVIDVRRFSTLRWPRFVLDYLHRNVALLAMVFLLLHILTSVLDSFAPVSLTAAVIPFISPYRPFWLGLGAIAFDLLVAVTITSLVRRRLGHAAWRATHWLSYLSWPVALLHGFGSGSDVKSTWLLLLSLGCLIAVLIAVSVRSLTGWPSNARARAGAIGVTCAFAMALVLWLPSGPLGSGWAQRAGTPTNLLAHSTSASASAGHR